MCSLTNKDLRSKYNTVKYVLLVEKDGVQKYISREYCRKNSYKYTVLLNKAMLFDTMGCANNFAEKNNITNASIESVCISYNLLNKGVVNYGKQ